MIVSKIDSGAVYTSDIDVSFNCKGSVFKLNFKNQGTLHLFDTITKALAGYDIKNSVPHSIDILQEVGGREQSCLSKKVPLTGIVYGDAADSGREVGTGVLKLNAFITFEDKQSLSSLNNPQLVVRDIQNNILCRIGGENYTTNLQALWSHITADTDAIIEWKLIFKNLK